MFTVHAVYRTLSLHKGIDMKLKYYGFKETGGREFILDRTIDNEAALELYKEIFSEHEDTLSFRKTPTGRKV